MEDDRYTRITLRIPKDLHAALAAEADSTSKSLNAEIIARLAASLEQPGFSSVKMMGKIGDAPSIIDEIAAKLAATPAEKLALPLAEIIDDLRQTQGRLTKAAADAERTIKIIRRELPSGTPYRSDPLALIRHLIEDAEERQRRAPRVRPRALLKRTTLRKHVKRKQKP
ncbi:toxin-antitoxin system HicB family antitoxin [Thauera humireducens]|uniref:Arc-like DNA binding domain-containing protein n=1 Tax=Thauera humireducens TaxID=1134435 RepID=A0A127K365_9RHOO|nr:toxin-antitoxin system HicB family antitoxin [Thauera humireducens]AMO36399.1 hypothetical protein AC731_005290 [Thauera humireducens]